MITAIREKEQNKRQSGTVYESIVSNWLEERGFRILKRNYRTRIGEIDIIAKDGEYYCFIEVKFRSTDGYGSGFDAVDYKKQTNICRVARSWMRENALTEWTPCRFDVVSVSGSFLENPGIELMKNAFEYHLK